MPARRVGVVLVALLSPLAWQSPGPAAATEIEAGIHRLDGLDASLPHQDLRPLEQIVKKATVLGLGEAVHTTEGFSRAKVRLFRYLVEEMGFRAFGFESPWISAERTAEYVATCRGSTRSAMRGLFGVWQNESVQDLLSWMCRWNRDHPEDPLFFYGFDHQQGPQDHLRLRQFLEGLGFDDADERLLGIERCRTGSQTASQSDHDACVEALDQIWRYFADNEPAIVDRTSVEELEWARIHVVGLESHEGQTFYRFSDPRRSTESRDSGMAYIAAKIRELRYPNAKTALWAHNFHISRGKIARTRLMGFFLKKLFRRKYRAIGLIAFEAETDWPGVNCGPFATAEEGSVEWRLRQLGEPYLLVNLAFPGGEPPFLAPRRKYLINWGWRLVPKKLFNGLVYLDRAESMEPLAWSSCNP